jgi:hypothetical protein
MDLLSTCTHHTELRFTGYWHTQTSVLSLLLSPITVSWQMFLPRGVLQRPPLRSSFTTTRKELSSTGNSTNWAPCWRPFHSTFLTFSSRADSHLTTNGWILSHKPATSRRFSQLNCWQTFKKSSRCLKMSCLKHVSAFMVCYTDSFPFQSSVLGLHATGTRVIHCQNSSC